LSQTKAAHCKAALCRQHPDQPNTDQGTTRVFLKQEKRGFGTKTTFFDFSPITFSTTTTKSLHLAYDEASIAVLLPRRKVASDDNNKLL